MGDAPAVKKIISEVQKVADTKATVLISGESGTGKELIAQMIHNNSSRRARSFIKVNCSAIPDSLVESELFGHEKGSFTGSLSK
jgi:transcriptional regulator with GAF, ATPase, and Fis domain